MLLKIYILSLFIVTNCQNEVLDNLDINPDTISVSGLSSGACFATQFHTAFSASVSFISSKDVTNWDIPR